MKRKNAQVMQIGTAIFWMVLLTLQIFGVSFMVKMFIQTTIDIRGVEARIFINKAIYSPHGITLYEPDIDRVYPNIIDMTKFETSYIESAVFNPESFKVGMKLDLKNIHGDKLKTIFMDEESYFADVEAIYEDRIVVIDHGDGRREPGILRISIA
jgi:hypothetical protein